MLGWVDLKPCMAACWKVSWNVDPLALSVPERLEPPLLPDPLLLLLLDDELQAAENKAIATTASPAVVTRCMRRRCISKTPIPRRNKYLTPAPDNSQRASELPQMSLACRQYPQVKERNINGEKCVDRR